MLRSGPASAAPLAVSLLALSSLAVVAACVGSDVVTNGGGPGDDGGTDGQSLVDGGGGGDGGTQETGTTTPQLLTVAPEVGSGGGTVVSDVPGINCGSQCSASFPGSSKVTLTSTPANGSAFVGWKGDGARCGGLLGCEITMDAPKTVGALFAQLGTAGWALQVAGAGGPRTATDKDGNLVVAAQFAGGITLGGQAFTTKGATDVVVLKISPGGEVRWARTLGGTASDGVSAVAVDPTNGDVVVSGLYESPSFDLGGPTPLANDTQDIYVARFGGTDGAFQWQRRVQADDADEPNMTAIGVDASGNVLVTGHFNTTIDLGNGVLSAGSGEQQMFVGKLAKADGAVVWKKMVAGTSAFAIPTNLVVDKAGNFTVAGNFGSVLDLDGVAGNDITAQGTYDVFVAKLSGTDGALTWQQRIGGTQSDYTYGLTISPDDTVSVVVAWEVVAGQTPAISTTNLPGSGTGTDIVVGKLNGATGGVVWAKRFGGTGNEYGYALASFANGDIAMTGYFSAGFAMDAQSLTPSGTGTESYFAVLGASNGLTRWATRVGSLGADIGRSVAVSGNGLYGLGSFTGQGTFLGKTLNAAGTDLYVFAVPVP